MLVAACLVARRPGSAATTTARALDLVLPAGLGLVALGLIHGVQSGALGLETAAIGPVFGGLLLLSLAFAGRPVRFGLGVGALLLAATTYHGAEGRLIHAERSFFGVSRVTRDPSERFQVLLHGTTLHGMQSLDQGRRLEPLTYLARSGPLGQLFAALGGGPLTRRVAVVGLGAGSVACHGRAGERWTFYEIDPVVERIAREPRYFTFLRDCPPTLDVVMGDARLSLRAAPDGEYGLIVLDAYSSDAPPLHLITREAVLLYRAKLAPGGVLVFNISNRHLELEPVLGALARAGLVALAQDDPVVHARAWQEGKRPSQWVVMARQPADLGPLGRDPRWQPALAPPGTPPWTDDFNSLLSAFRWH
jgi:spermidine synthase